MNATRAKKASEKASEPPIRRVAAMDVHVGKQIRIARLKLGMSQEKLGDALGLTFQQVQKYEKGTNRVASSRLSQIVAILKLKGIESLFEGGPGYAAGNGKAANDGADDMLLTNEGQQMAKLWQQLPPTVRRRLLRLVQSVINPEEAEA